MKLFSRRLGILFTVFTLLVSSLFNILLSANAFAATPTAITYTKTGEVNNCTTLQGNATDGTNVYFICASGGNTTALIKLKLDGTEVTRKSYPQSKFDHASGMVYNSKTKELIVTTSGGGTLVKVSPDTLSITNSITADAATNLTTLCYSAKNDQYVGNGTIYDSNFKSTGKQAYSSSEVDKLAGSSTGQGIACDESFIYVMRGGLGGGVNNASGKFKIIVYDWSGKNTAIYDGLIDKYSENKGLFVAGGKLYVGVNVASPGKDKENYGTLDGITTGQGTGKQQKPLILGSYNLHYGYVIGGESGCQAKTRIENAVKHVVNAKMDIVGLQEYGGYDKNKKISCNGAVVNFLDMLNAASGTTWGITKEPSGTDGGGYQETQASIIYNKSTTTLVSDDAKNVEGGSIKSDSWSGSSGCHGGSPIFHIAGFSGNGSTFYVANGHWCTQDESYQSVITKKLLTIMNGYNGAKFVIGDTNSRVGEGVEDIMAAANYGDAHVDALNKVGADLSTMAGGTGKSSNVIDRIYYDKSTVTQPPSNYETISCKTDSECGSDHRPIYAIFPSILIGGGGAGGACQNANSDQFSEWYILFYDPSCSACTDSSSVMVGDTNFKKIATYMAGKGFKDYAIAGILANFNAESGLSAFRVQNQTSASTSNNPPPSGGGYGIAQFTPATKIEKVLKQDSRTQADATTYYTVKYGGPTQGDWKTGTGIPAGAETVNDNWLQVQLDFLYKGEMSSTKVGSYRNMQGVMGLDYIQDGATISEALMAAQNEQDAARIFVWIYERPADKSGAASGRQKTATEMLPVVQALIGSSGGSLTGTTDANASASTSCATDTNGGVTSLGDIAFPLAIKTGDITTSGNAWTHTYHEDTCSYYYALDMMINMDRGIERTVNVVAMHDGQVVKAGFGGVTGYGNMIVIHDAAGLNWSTLHVDQVKVSKGQTVKKGDVIGVGVVNANGYHLHVDLSKGSTRPSACASCSPKICPAQGEFLQELRPKLKEIYESMGSAA